MRYDLYDALAARRMGYAPNVLAWRKRAGQPDQRVELESYPFPDTDGRSLWVQARLTPGDPMSMVTLKLGEVFP